MDYNPNQIVPIGTQVVINVEIKRQNGELDFPRGTVGVIVKSPPDNTHTYRDKPALNDLLVQLRLKAK